MLYSYTTGKLSEAILLVSEFVEYDRKIQFTSNLKLFSKISNSLGKKTEYLCEFLENYFRREKKYKDQIAKKKRELCEFALI